MSAQSNTIRKITPLAHAPRRGNEAALPNRPQDGPARRETGGGPVAPLGDHHGKFPRFSPRQEMFVFHQGIGRVLDISMGGVSFSYVAEKSQPAELPGDAILFTNHGQHLENIPIEIVSDQICSRFFHSAYFIMERRARFGELTEAQVRQLESFILNNARIPQCSHDARFTEYRSVYPPGGHLGWPGKQK